MTKAFHSYESLRLAIAEALGGTPKEDNDSQTVQSFDELVSAFRELGGMVV